MKTATVTLTLSVPDETTQEQVESLTVRMLNIGIDDAEATLADLDDDDGDHDARLAAQFLVIEG